MLNNFYTKENEPYVVNWIQKLNLTLKKEKEEFISKIKKSRSKYVKEYLIIYKIELESLWKALIFFYMLNGWKNIKILNHKYINYLRDIVLVEKEEKNKI